MDTALITEIYMQRPVSMMCLTLGQWFNNAINLNDGELAHTDTRNAKLTILNKGYNHIENLLNKLKAYNHAGNSSH